MRSLDMKLNLCSILSSMGPCLRYPSMLHFAVLTPTDTCSCTSSSYGISSSHSPQEDCHDVPQNGKKLQPMTRREGMLHADLVLRRAAWGPGWSSRAFWIMGSLLLALYSWHRSERLALRRSSFLVSRSTSGMPAPHNQHARILAMQSQRDNKGRWYKWLRG